MTRLTWRQWTGLALMALLASCGPAWAGQKPEVERVEPGSGRTVGGESISIYGQYFENVTQVQIGAVPYHYLVSDYTVINQNVIRINSTPPDMAVGNYPVYVSTQGGGQSMKSTPLFEVYDSGPPDVTDLSPNQGPIAGGNSITISGRNFTGATGVTFGSNAVPASKFIVADDRTIMVNEVPASTPGSVTVSVTTGLGSSASSPQSQYTYRAPPPEVNSITPDSGKSGITVKISGQNLFGAQVMVGSAAVGSVTINSAGTEIEFTMPPAAVMGPENVKVTTPEGQATTTFTYLPGAAPIINHLEPSRGLVSGGEEIWIHGHNFYAAQSVTIDSNPVTFSVETDSLIKFVAPAHAAGPVSVSVTGALGGVGSETYTYIALADAPRFHRIEPASGPLAGKYVIIHGEGLHNVNSLTLSGPTTISAFNSQTSTSIGFTMPPVPSNRVVTIAPDLGSDRLWFTYTDSTTVPKINSLNPSSGYAGQIIDINGTNLGQVSRVTFGTVDAIPLESTQSTVKVVVPTGLSGKMPVTVHVGTTFSSNALLFECTTPPAPVIGGISPDRGPAAGGSHVVISGTNLTYVNKVLFNGNNISFIRVADSLIITVPAGTPGTQVPVQVWTGVVGSNTIHYHYMSPSDPNISSLIPSSGPVSGGDTVVIAGTNLGGVTAVEFGTSTATIQSKSATKITVITPPGSHGGVPVRVRAGAVVSNDYLYQYIDPNAPQIISASPLFGLESGGTEVTIEGKNLDAVTSVMFWNTPAARVDHISPTRIVAVSPAGTESRVEVTLASPLGNAIFYFDYFAAAQPVISRITPDSGLPTGNYPIRIHGRGFAGVKTIKFGSESVTNFTILGDSEIEVMVPAGLGAVEIVLVTPNFPPSNGHVFRYEEDTRPDPSQDPDVRAVVNAHVTSAERFYRVQSASVTSRLRSIRRLNFDGSRVNDFNFSLSAPTATLSAMERRQAYAQLNSEVGSVNAGDAFRCVTGKAVQTPWSFWSDGTVAIGSQDEDAGFDYTTYNFTLGADYAFGSALVAGLAAGYTDDRTDIGTHGSETSGYAYTAMAYLSWSPTESFFVEGMAGYSGLNLDSKRHTANGYARGDRGGNQYFGSVAAGWDLRRGNFLFSPFGTLQAAHTTLDSYREKGGGNLALRYGEVDIDMAATSAGLRSEYTFTRDWGTLTPWAGVEYTYNAKGRTNAKLGYTDQADLPYTIRASTYSSSSFAASAGIRALVRERYSVGVDYNGTFANNRQDHRFSVQVGWTW